MNDIRSILDLTEGSDSKLTRVKLDFNGSALSPAISSAALKFHYDTLYKRYVDNYNKGDNKAFNEAGAYLHELYFSQLGRARGIKPTGAIKNLIERHFDNFIDFKKSFTEVALSLKGSGWVYLSKSGRIQTISNHAKRADIALIIDMWEHSWMPDHHSKEKYLDAIWKIMDWSKINKRL